MLSIVNHLHIVESLPCNTQSYFICNRQYVNLWIANEMLNAFTNVVGHVRQMVKSSVAQMSSLLNYDFETLELTQPRDHVYQVNINRPEKRNAMNQTFWK